MDNTIINPSDATFTFYNHMDDGQDEITETSFSVYVTSLKEPDNDDIREVNHPYWEDIFGNMMENLFELKPNKHGVNNLSDAKQWMLSIGMTEYDHDDVMNRF